MTPTSDSEEPLILSMGHQPNSGSNCAKVSTANTLNVPRNRLSLAVKVLFLIALSVSVVYLLVMTTDSSDRGPRHQLSGDYALLNVATFYNASNVHLPSDVSGHKYVLLYSDFYDDDRNWYLGQNLIADSYFKDWQCPETRCIVTSNRTYFPGGIKQFDALLFFAHNKWDMAEYPAADERSDKQIYIVSMLETPPHTWRRFEKDWNYFNWTMSFRFESDVFWPYGSFVELHTNVVITPAHRPVWRQLDANHFERPFFKNESLLALISEKADMAAWFVSNCKLTPSKRMDVAKAMQNYVQVDIYGKCGTKSCPIKEHGDCQLMLEKNYKFYLSFENSLCKDYLTEKVFSNMNYFIIPVVYNAAENHKFLPPNSYLNVLDYATIKELTDHMQYLADHPEEYIKYFWWKEFYYVRSGYNFCDLCVKLHEMELTERRQYYRDLDAWYRNGACIETPHIPLE